MGLVIIVFIMVFVIVCSRVRGWGYLRIWWEERGLGFGFLDIGFLFCIRFR